MSSRTKILNRIREALQVMPPRPLPAPPGMVFPPITASERGERFEREVKALHVDFYEAMDWGDAEAWTKTFVQEREWSEIVATPDPDAMELGKRIGARILGGERDCGKQLAKVDLAITSCECLVARTGSVVVSSHQGFGRVVSILPPAHLVVARRSQLLSDLSEAIQFVRSRHGRFWPSMVSVITGPSRTADIEKTLVLGAHGPKKLLVLLLDD